MLTSYTYTNFTSRGRVSKRQCTCLGKPTLLKSFIERYHVKYLLLDSDENHRVPPEIGGMDENI